MTDVPQAGFWSIAEADPDRIAIVDGRSEPATFGEVLTWSRRIARGLRALGLGRGDHIAMVLPNDRSFVETWLAAAESGLYVTPVNFHLAAPEIAYVLGDSEAKAIFVHEELADVCAAAIAEAGIPTERCFSFGAVTGCTAVEELLSGGAEPLADPSPGALMMYTSGTTGRPKGVKRPLLDGDAETPMRETATLTARGFDIPIGEGASLVCGPLYHAGPFLQLSTGLNVGHRVVLLPKFDAERCLALVEQYGITDTQMVPTMFHRLLALPDDVRTKYDLSSLVSILHSGAPCPVETKQKMMDWLGPVIYETYGGTEAAATIAKPKRWLEKPGTVGKPIHGVRVRILDDDGNDVPVGTQGTVHIESTRHPDAVYFKDPEKTKNTFKEGGVTLGDVGYLDEDGFLFLCDRKIDMVISGGVNIYPAEVEAALLTHPAVADAVVLGAPDPEWGERVHAVVEPTAGSVADDALAAELIAHCQARIARFKCPRTVEFVGELPRLPNGKVEKRRLRDTLWAAEDQKI
ncbi:MAG: AMP-binding protein [Ilumatobacteraceae bacterium]